MVGNLLNLSYRLNRYYWNGWPLDRWIALLPVVGGVLFVGGILPGGRGAALASGLVLLGLLGLQTWARRRGYISFLAQPAVPDAQAQPLPADTSVPIRATGRFEVQTESRTFVELEAEFQSFEIREHAIVGRRRAARFLLLGKPPESEAGMWYIFFKPQMLRSIRSGLIDHGAGTRPALRVEFEVEKQAEKRASLLSARGPRVYNEVVYLTFESEADRRRVWSNLLYDAPATVAG